jgi:hypothetical protein
LGEDTQEQLKGGLASYGGSLTNSVDQFGAKNLEIGSQQKLHMNYASNQDVLEGAPVETPTHKTSSNRQSQNLEVIQGADSVNRLREQTLDEIGEMKESHIETEAKFESDKSGRASDLKGRRGPQRLAGPAIKAMSIAISSAGRFEEQTRTDNSSSPMRGAKRDMISTVNIPELAKIFNSGQMNKNA